MTVGLKAWRTRWVPVAAFAVLVVVIPAAVATTTGAGSAAATPRTIVAVGAENEYANVISQIGGPYVSVSAVMSDPNTDPHTFEASPSVARVVSSADLVVDNGVGYDSFMTKIMSASSNPGRKVIDVQHLLGLPDSTENPHLWYTPRTMPAVAGAIGRDLTALRPAAASYFRAKVTAFDRSLGPWRAALARLKARFPHVAVAVTEPVGDYMLQAAGADIVTPWTLQADIMNGVDPSPQNVSLEESLFSDHRAKVFVYNQQVTDSLTLTFLTYAKKAGVPVVGVYETMPTPGYDYQSWMLAEVRALTRALSSGRSTARLR
jgi:zinc/manganese transport system substrate-binding protein